MRQLQRADMQALCKRIVILFVLSTMLSAAAVATEVYRWVDAEGRVHYSDRKSASIDAERLQINTPTGTPAAPTSTPALPSEAKPAAATPRQPISVVMYLSPTCGWCRKAAQHFNQRGIPWRGLDITASKQAKRDFDQAGGRGTPLIFIEGQRIRGFNAERIDRLLARYGW